MGGLVLVRENEQARRPIGLNPMQSTEIESWTLETLDAATTWGARPSIYAHVEAAVRALEEPAFLGELPLPDGAVEAESAAAGAVFGSELSVADERLRAKQIAKAVRDLLADSSVPNLRHLARLLSRGPVLGVLDDVLAEVVARGELQPDRFHRLAMFLIREAPERELVKLGIGMLGVLVGCDEREVLLTIGRHEEFTLFAAVALAATLERPQVSLWALAKGARAWGRIHAVERLAESLSADPDPGELGAQTFESIRAWLVREGYRNAVMDDYLALTCARAGRLEQALAADIVDDALLDGAAGILAALLRAGPAEHIEDYGEAPQVAQAYLRHLSRRPEHRPLDLIHLLVAEQLREFIAPVGDELEDDATLRALGWDLDCRAAVIEMAGQVVARSEWREQVEAGLAGEDELRFHQADAAAQLLGIDSWPHHHRRVAAEPLHSQSWFPLVHTEDEARLDVAIELARTHLPLDAIATGPADEPGLGPEFDVHDTLLIVVHGLVDRSGKGAELLAAALRSPATRIRRGAVRVLSTWGEGLGGLEPALRAAEAIEPDRDLRSDMQTVLASSAV